MKHDARKNHHHWRRHRGTLRRSLCTKVRVSGRSPRDAPLSGRLGDELAPRPNTPLKPACIGCSAPIPNGDMYSRWLEVFDINKLTFVYPDEFVRLETEHGEHLSIYSNVDRLEKEMLRRAPQDAAEIHNFASAIRSLSKFKMPDPTEGWGGNWLTYLRDIPYLPLLHELSDMSSKEYGYKFTDPLIRAFFGEGDMGELSALALFFSLAWMSGRDAGYPIGGSQAVIQGIADKLGSLGGRLRLGAKVGRILVEDDAAVGVQLTDGETIAADWVISAADGHATIYELLGGKYRDTTTEKIYSEFKTFPSYLQVSLGVALDLSDQPGLVTRLLGTPLEVDPGTELRQLSFRFFHFDPGFAPPGKTAVTCFLPTRNFEYWVRLQQQDFAGYQNRETAHRRDRHRHSGENARPKSAVPLR